MTTKEAQKHSIIAQATDGQLSEQTASEKLGLSIRQIQRLKSDYRKEGVSGMIHGLRGQPSNYRSPPRKEELYEAIHGILISDEKYAGCGPTFTLEQLMKDHPQIFHPESHSASGGRSSVESCAHSSLESLQGTSLESDFIVFQSSLTPQTLRSKMTLWGLWKEKKTKEKVGAKHLKWREPKETLGEMVQFDGSYHAWLEGRDGMDVNGKPNTCCLLLATDDATGRIMKAQFTVNEGIKYIFPFWREYIEDTDLGKPYSLYLDKFATYKINYPTAGDTSDVVTQFGRVCRELNISLIFANSPQAKGRVERMNGTLQDRLVKALRFAGINTVSEANAFLTEVFIPEFNAKFGRPAKNPNGNLHTALTEQERDVENNGLFLSSLFAIHEERKIQNDFTIRHDNQFYQLYFTKGVTPLKQAKVRVERWMDNSIHIRHRGIEIAHQSISKFQRESSYKNIKMAPVLRT